MPTVAEILKASGLDDAAIAALDAKVLAGFNGVLTTAEQERTAAQEAAKKAEKDAADAKAAQEAAELAGRANKEFYDQTVMPSLTSWEEKEKALQSELANSKALAAFYETQNKAAKDAGFVAADAPKFTPEAQARDDKGKFVAGAPGATPGSPSFKIEDVEDRLGKGLDNSVWALQEFQRLSGGQFLPDSISSLAQEANNHKLPFRDYVARKYDFAGKSAALQAKAEAEKADAIAKAAIAPYEEKLKAKDAEWQQKLEEQAKTISERGGNNPDVRRAAVSNYPEIQKAVKDGTRKDPLSMTREERQSEMRRQIREDVTANEEAKVGA